MIGVTEAGVCDWTVMALQLALVFSWCTVRTDGLLLSAFTYSAPDIHTAFSAETNCIEAVSKQLDDT